MTLQILILISHGEIYSLQYQPKFETKVLRRVSFNIMRCECSRNLDLHEI